MNFFHFFQTHEKHPATIEHPGVPHLGIRSNIRNLCPQKKDPKVLLLLLAPRGLLIPPPDQFN